eukprot:2804321-Rhodomonas_salina.5
MIPFSDCPVIGVYPAWHTHMSFKEVPSSSVVWYKGQSTRIPALQRAPIGHGTHWDCCIYNQSMHEQFKNVQEPSTEVEFEGHDWGPCPGQ